VRAAFRAGADDVRLAVVVLKRGLIAGGVVGDARWTGVWTLLKVNVPFGVSLVAK
jgi:hypothetical protein